MAYLLIEPENNYKVILDEPSFLFVPEFRTIISNKKQGWNFFYYVILFCSRYPFGNMEEKERDEKVATLIRTHPYKPEEERNTKGFFQNNDFIKAQETYLKLFPDPEFDYYQMIIRDLKELIDLNSKLDKTKPTSAAMSMTYYDTIGKITKIRHEVENQMNSKLKSTANVVGLGAVMKLL